MKTFAILFTLLIAGVVACELAYPDKRSQVTRATLAMTRSFSSFGNALKPHLPAWAKSVRPEPPQPASPAPPLEPATNACSIQLAEATTNACPPKHSGFILIQRAKPLQKAGTMPSGTPEELQRRLLQLAAAPSARLRQEELTQAPMLRSPRPDSSRPVLRYVEEKGAERLLTVSKSPLGR